MGYSGIDFARQLREANGLPQKKFRSTAAPKGTKLASGYVDRTQLRASIDEDEKASRVKSLEEMVKLGQMEYSTFEKLRDEIVGGDVSNVHLVKGLDRKLLERARKGEDVFKKPEIEGQNKDGEKEEAEPVDVEAALDQLEDKDVVPIERPKEKEQDTQPVVAKKRTRDDILRELRASRLKVKAEPAPALGSKFRKLDAQPQPGTSRIERDEKGREVLITVDEDGKVKRRVRKAKPSAAPDLESEQKNGLLMPAKDAIPLDADAPIIPQQPAPAEEPSGDEDVFEGAGADYDPLGDAEDSSSDSSSAESGEETQKAKKPDRHRKRSNSPSVTAREATTNMPPPPLPSKPRNYFSDKPSASSDDEPPSNPLKDPSFLAVLQKASSIARRSSDGDEEDEDPEAREEARRLARRKAMLETHDRDAEDMDLGFGSSRFEDQEEGEDRLFKLSRWEGDEEDGEEKGGRGGKTQRKRGKKKKKGDKDSASDVLAVLEKRGRG